MLTWLRSFDAAARHLSFTSAAQELNLTQGAVSQQVKLLEEALGFPVFQRRPGSLHLTREGQELEAVVSQSFASLRCAMDRFSRPTGLRPIRLSCPPSFAIRWLSPRLERFAQAYPKLDVRFHGEFPEPRRHETMRHLSISIRYCPHTDFDDRTTMLLDEYLVPVASPAFISNCGTKLRKESFDPSCLLHDDHPWDGAPIDQEWREWFDGTGSSLPILSHSRRFNLFQLALTAALNGSGIALGRLSLVLDDLQAGRLALVSNVAVRATASYWVADDGDSSSLLVFRRWLADESQAFVAERDRFLEEHSVTIIRPNAQGG